MFIIQGLLNTPSLVLYGSKNRLKTCERFALLDPRIPMRGSRLTALQPFYRMRRLPIFDPHFFVFSHLDKFLGLNLTLATDTSSFGTVLVLKFGHE